MPAAGRSPEEVAKCFTKAGRVRPLRDRPTVLHDRRAPTSSTSRPCDAMKAPWNLRLRPEKSLDPGPQPRLRPGHRRHPGQLRRRHHRLDRHLNVDDIFSRVQAGDLDSSIADQPPAGAAAVPDRLGQKPFLHSDSGDRTWYVTMNLAHAAVRRPPRPSGRQLGHGQPPASAQGLGRFHLRPGHRHPHHPPMRARRQATSQRLRALRQGNRGDEAKAKEEMKQSKYDSNKDGVCDAKRVHEPGHDHRRPPVDVDFIPVVDSDLKTIGIKVKERDWPQGRLHTIQTPRLNTPLPDAAWLGQGLRRRDHLRRPAVRRAHHHPDGQHELLAPGDDARHGQEGRREGQPRRRAERRRRHRQVQRH